MCHWPFDTWRASHYNSWMIHGHVHSSYRPEGKTMNLSVESLDYEPLSYEELEVIMEGRENNKNYLGDRK